MLQINCPWCGERAEPEFTCGGEGGIVRPLTTETMTDAQWGDYVLCEKIPRACTTSNGATRAAAAAGSMPCASNT